MIKINNFISRNSKMNFHKFKKNLKSRSEIIVHETSQFAKIRNNVFIYSLIFQFFFLIIEINFLNFLFIIIIVILKSFFDKKKMRMKFIIIM